MTRRSNTAEFIQKAMVVHGDKYNYDNVRYIDTHTKVEIECPTHGVFQQRPNRHLQGDGCQLCGYHSNAIKHKNKAEDVIAQALKIHNGKYKYHNVVYSSMTSSVVITCPIHGDFSQTFSDHIHCVAGCPQCANIIKSASKLLTQEDFLSQACIVHDDRYDYSQAVYGGFHKHVTVICSKHGPFQVSPSNHIHCKSGCPKCISSKGENEVRRLLIKHGYVFDEQKTFTGCVSPITGARLRYDFYLPSMKVLIEYDGVQHFDPISIKGIRYVADSFEIIQMRDKAKNQFAIENGYKLIRIPYYVLDIEEYLLENLSLNKTGEN